MFQALINHSCDPCYRRINFGNKTLAFATKNILEGEEISDTYCQTFAAVSRDTRAKALTKYNFSCACDACRNNWPTLSELPQKLTGLPAVQCKLSVEKEVKVQAKKVATCESIAAKYVRDGADREAVLKAQMRCCAELEKLVRPPHYKLTLAESRFYDTMLAVYATRSTHFSI